jgi:predicted GNAT family acetyltransferase
MKQQQQTGAATPQFAHNEAESRYELRIDGRVAAKAEYRKEGSTVCFTHTEVDSAYEGQGLGSQLAAQSLDDVKRRGLKADPRCSFIAGYIEKNEKEYGELVAR